MTNKKPVGIKETLTSLLIAFMMAFIFRGFVVEGFIIPTGSMAPTLLGKHLRFTSPYSGYDWTTGPWDYTAGVPDARQGAGEKPPLTPSDPMTGLPVEPQRDRRLAAGDRVFVLKYLPGVHHPHRWDVVVFKNPGTMENYIKRLVGLPGEQVSLVDGDVFTRPFDPGVHKEAGPETWTAGDWTIARKSERTQRTMFQAVYDSRYTPVRAEPSYRPPVSAQNPGAWAGTQDSSTWTYSGSGPTELYWNDLRPITDYYPYNQASAYRDRNGVPPSDPGSRPEDLAARAVRPYPVSDLALTLAIEPTDQPVTVTPTVEARGYVFEGVLDAQAHTATVRMRPENQPDAWTNLDTAKFSGLTRGSVTNVEFWHVDQALWLFVNGRLVAGGPDKGAYTLTPAQRIDAAMVPTWEELVAYPSAGDGVSAPGVFARNELYRAPKVRWDFTGGAFKVHRVALDRDIFYQPAPAATAQVTRGAHYNNFPTLSDAQFFMCGDNSPNSLDGRYWTQASMNPWIRDKIDPTPGVVNRDLIVGRAFVVYFPAPLDGGPVLSPDVGRVRWIW